MVKVDAAREARLAQALRENLSRRKEQARARRVGTGEAEPRSATHVPVDAAEPDPDPPSRPPRQPA